MDDFAKELKVGFLDEAEQSIADVEQTFLSLETDPHNKEHINKIFRLAHNLKGSSKAVGFDQFGQFTHEFESFVLRVKNDEIKVSAATIGLLLKAVDFSKKMIDGLKLNLDASFDIQTTLNEIKAFNENDSTQYRGTAGETTATFETVIDINATQQKTQSATDESIRVSMSKIEKLLNVVGEMVILQSVLAQKNEAGGSDSRRTIHDLIKITREIQDISMGLRMVPIKPVFQKMQRIVRDTSQALNKEVLLNLFGEELELDKTILENINDPLTHLIRNSIDHGIEPTELRTARGKSAQGHVELKAYHRASRLIIEVIDDGNGLDPVKLKKKAIEKGIIKENANLSDQECFGLIFAAGFSTKEQVTEVSGRGVGMDVVRTNIESLGGEVEIESVLGNGTTIRVILPLTMAIIEALVVVSSQQKYVIPLSHVHETLQARVELVHQSSTLGKVLLLRGENLPLYRLSDFFGLQNKKKDTEMIAIVVRSTSKTFALLVDDIIGQHQVVVKQLSPDLQGFKGASGTTILGDGKPYLILEPNELLQRKIVKIEFKEQKQKAA